MKTWNTVAIVGVGLLGGSVGLALRERKLASRIVGIGHARPSLETALQMGAVDEITQEIAEGAKGADLVVVCTPVAVIAEHVRAAAVVAADGAVITDVGSTKVDIVAKIGYRWPRNIRFVGSHPLAGGEKSGPAAARADLFIEKTVVITPSAKATLDDRLLVADFWESLGGVAIEMSAEEHDRAVAFTSHAPHLIAAAMAAALPQDYFPLVARGFLDTTRVAAGNPDLWRQIVFDNRQNVSQALAAVAAQLERLRHAIDAHDEHALVDILTLAKRNRDAVGS